MSRVRIESVDEPPSVMESVMEPDSMAEEDNIIRPVITSPGISTESERRRSIRTRNSIEQYFNDAQYPDDLPHEQQQISYREATESYDDDDLVMKAKNAYRSPTRSLSKSALYDKKESSDLDGLPEKTKSNLYSVPSGYYSNGKSIDLQLSKNFRQGSTGTHAEKHRPSWKDIPVLAVSATPVTQSDNTSESLEKICKETKNNSRIIRILILLVLILIGVAGVAGYLALKDQGSGKDNSQASYPSRSGSTDYPSQNVATAPTSFPSPPPTIPRKSLRPSTSLSNKPTSLPTKIPTTTPTLAPTLFPTPVPTSEPTSEPTPAPTQTSSLPPSVVSSAKPSPQNCANWCTNHSVPWKSKCKWSDTCGSCPECELLSPEPSPSPTSASPTVDTCKNWCHTNETPWYDPDPQKKQKCRYPQNCAGCPECSDPDIFPPAGN